MTGLYRTPWAATLGLVMACHSGSTQPRTPVPADSVDQHDSQTRVVVEGTSLYLLGTFDGGTPALVEGALDSSAEVDTLVFTVNGGSIDDDATLSLGRRLRERGIRTMVVSEGVIASGGVSLFLSGVDRTVERGAKIGVHSWQHCWGDADGQEPGCRQAMDHPRDDPGHDLHGDYTSEMLGSRDFYWFAIGASPSDSIHWMTDAEIERFGLSSNGVVDASSPNPFGPAFDQARADVLGSG